MEPRELKLRQLACERLGKEVGPGAWVTYIGMVPSKNGTDGTVILQYNCGRETARTKSYPFAELEAQSQQPSAEKAAA